MTAERDSSMQNQAYQFIRKKIERCEYAPNDMLSESLLREELGFSRTPVREAIGRLAQEGLVRVYPKRGIMVSAISIGDIHQIFEVRALVERWPRTTTNLIWRKSRALRNFSTRTRAEAKAANFTA